MHVYFELRQVIIFNSLFKLLVTLTKGGVVWRGENQVIAVSLNAAFMV